MAEAEILPPPIRRAPMDGPLIVLTNGCALVEQPEGYHAPVRVTQGLALGWMPASELGGILINIRDAHCLADPLATTLTRAGLQNLIADLQSIDAQLEELDRCRSS